MFPSHRSPFAPPQSLLLLYRAACTLGELGNGRLKQCAQHKRFVSVRQGKRKIFAAGIRSALLVDFFELAIENRQITFDEVDRMNFVKYIWLAFSLRFIYFCCRHCKLTRAENVSSRYRIMTHHMPCRY